MATNETKKATRAKKATKKAVSQMPARERAKVLTQAQRIKQAAKDIEEARLAAQDLEVTDIASWKRSVEDEGTKLLLPSGNVCLARNPGMSAFLEQGLIPNGLMPIVEEAINQGKGLSPAKTEEVARDPKMLGDVVNFANTVLVHSVIQPPVLMPPVWTESDADEGTCKLEDIGKTNAGKKDANLLYADDVLMEDRLFILQWVVGGTRDLERFREQQAAALEGMAAEQGSQDETE